MSAVTSKLDPVVYREGMLYKRQRGLKTGNAKKLKFQERFCKLTCTSLDYYDPNPKKRLDGPKGQFAVEQIKVVEAMEKELFGKEFPYTFQIGDSTEVMYFVAKTEKEMLEWLAACRHVAKDAGNIFLSFHHHGVFGLANKGRWSCCANPRRACPGCSPSTLNPDKVTGVTLPVMRLTPPTKRNPRSPTSLTNESTSTSSSRSGTPCPRSTTPSHELETGKDTDNSEEEDEEEEPIVPPPMIRRFTLADPLMMPGTPQKLKELRKAFNEKEKQEDSDDMEDGGPLTEEQLTMKGAENDSDLVTERTNHSLNSLNSAGSGGQEEERKKEGDAISKESLIDVTSSESNKEDSPSNEVHTNMVNKKEGMMNHKKAHLLANNQRTGASSPSPSVDSGRGVSRPNSQIDVLDLRVSRTDSVGKKPVQSVVAESGAGSDHGRKHTTEQAIVEETDGPSKLEKQVSTTGSGTTSEEMEEKYKDRGTHPVTAGPEDSEENSSIVIRMTSPIRRSTSPEGGQPRPMSSILSGHDLNESDLMTPQHRKLLASMNSVGNSRQDRPKSGMISDRQFSQPCSQLHQACKDGNMLMLEEELNRCGTVNLDEVSSNYTPLFISYIHDHYQIMTRLLEHGADPNCVEPRKKMSLLQLASEKGCLDIVDLLIKYKADVNKGDVNGNTPLMMACKNGHLDVVELLLESGAHVDEDSNSQRTALHEATEGEHTDITELLLKQSDVDPTVRDDKDNTPYNIAYFKRNEELMLMLQLALPNQVRPYSLKLTNTEAASQLITAVVIKDTESIITGSRDCCVKFFSTADLQESFSLRLTDTVLDMSIHSGSHLILGSTSIQLMDMSAPEKRQIVADDSQEDESLHDPPLHLVRFGPKGRVVSASVESNTVKLWPSLAQNTGHRAFVESCLKVGEEKSFGTIYSLCMSPDPNLQWLAVAIQPGKISRPDGFKLVYCYDLKTRKLHHIFDAGDGGLGVAVCITFSPDGKKLAIGCSEHLCIWEIKTGSLLQKFTTLNTASILSLCYAPCGGHLAAGLSSGEIQVFEIQSSSPVFFLPPTDDPSPVTALTYSTCGKLFASAHNNGTLRLWEVAAS